MKLFDYLLCDNVEKTI